MLVSPRVKLSVGGRGEEGDDEEEEGVFYHAYERSFKLHIISVELQKRQKNNSVRERVLNALRKY